MLTHQPAVKNPKSYPRALCRLSVIAAVAGLAAAASMSSHAASGGEALDIELPSMRTPVEAIPASTTAADPARTATSRVQGEPLTRAQVRESLAMARLANLVTPSGEIGDTAEVLQAREDFNALQTEVLQAEHRTAALRLQQAQMDALMAQAEGYGTSADAAQTQQLESAAAAPAVEVVVVSSDTVYELLLEGGHAAGVTAAKGPAEVEAGAAEGPVTVLLLVNESGFSGAGDSSLTEPVAEPLTKPVPEAVTEADGAFNATSAATAQPLPGD